MGTFVAGYSITWLALVLYVGWMAHRQRRLARQYQALREQVEARQRPAASLSKVA